MFRIVINMFRFIIMFERSLKIPKR